MGVETLHAGERVDHAGGLLERSRVVLHQARAAEEVGDAQAAEEAARAAGDMGKVRHLEAELQGLKEYKDHHPGDNHDPTPLEVFCDLNPDAPECLVYDD